MKKKTTIRLLLILLGSIGFFKATAQELLLSKIFANPAGTDSPFEYVELVATKTIDFSVTPYSVVFSNNGAANSNGWVSGGALTYGFSITTGTVAAGNLVYVGGTSMAPTGTKLRVINTATTAGDRFGSAASGGVLGNGGVNADAVAVFNLPIASLTNSSVPIDAVFFGTGPTPGNAVVSAGTAGYQLPANDLYPGGKLQANSFIGPDPGNDDIFVLTGEYNTATGMFSSPRVLSVKTVAGGNPSGIPQNITFINSTSGTIDASVTELNFSSFTGTASDVQQYTVRSLNLTQDLIISAPELFSISLQPSGTYSKYISISAADANNKTIPIYVQYFPFKEGIVKGVIANTSGPSGSISEEVAVTGNTISRTPIYVIQGNGSESPLKGRLVYTEGIVTADYQASAQLNGFYIQDSTGDGNVATSDGIFVFDNGFGKEVKIGDKVSVVGMVEEFNKSTQITHVTSISILQGGGSISPVLVVLPVPLLSQLEQYEGMYVSFAQTLTVIENYNLGRYGELTLSSSGRQFLPTNYIDPNDADPEGTNSNGFLNVPAINDQFQKDSLNRILLDDGSNVQNPPIVPFIDSKNTTLRIGSTISNLAGILDFGFGVYRIEPINPSLAFSYAPRPGVPYVGNETLKIASFNVLNFFNGDGLGGGFPTERGANTLAEFKRQKAKIVAAIVELDPDVLGIMEMENDGDGPNSAIAELVNSLNGAIGTTVYNYIRDPKGAYGNTGTDAIKVASIFKIASVIPLGRAMADTSPVNNRPPLAQLYKVLPSGQKFSLIVNHLKSKGCDLATGADLDLGDGQSCFNDSRKQQAARLLEFISVVQDSANDKDVVSIGDYNAYEQEDPIDILVAGGLKNLITNNYSYVFNAYSGSIDHAFVTSEFFSSVTGADKWHINSDEPRLKDYNVEFNPAYVFSEDAFRSSDHDPVLLGFNLSSPITGFNDLSGLEELTSTMVNPNPSNAETNLTFNKNLKEDVEYSIVNLLGLKVVEGKITSSSSNTRIRTAQLPAGSYYIIFKNAEIAPEKLIVEH